MALSASPYPVHDETADLGSPSVHRTSDRPLVVAMPAPNTYAYKRPTVTHRALRHDNTVAETILSVIYTQCFEELKIHSTYILLWGITRNVSENSEPADKTIERDLNQKI
ncbi:predicted protein [Histoplasma mississippiense (nom. inval.)]|uniref:predicted protein n=1 Tax=Ajellomyces capsulatus (strain NAm1 / WU24) TaxID=2059318 RepID=UPI000157C8CA|nr:predicted protein [Histoplasma mississippiense (nom. inval.)]EDN09632.1 predicted protein [Histoplasma mississippiense (nom. inval.)]